MIVAWLVARDQAEVDRVDRVCLESRKTRDSSTTDLASCNSACVRIGKMALQIEGSPATPMWQMVREIEQGFEERLKQSESIRHHTADAFPDTRRRRNRACQSVRNIKVRERAAEAKI